MERKHIDKAIERLNLDDKTSGRRLCSVCGKTLKYKGPMANHIESKHEMRVLAEARKVRNEEAVTEVSFYHKHLFTYLKDDIARTNKKIAEYKKRLDKDFLNSFSWVMESLLYCHEEVALLSEAQEVIEGAETLEDVYLNLRYFQDRIKLELINNFPRHNSTNEFSNIQDRVRAQAKAELLKDSFVKGVLTEVVDLADKLTDLADKL